MCKSWFCKHNNITFLQKDAEKAIYKCNKCGKIIFKDIKDSNSETTRQIFLDSTKKCDMYIRFDDDGNPYFSCSHCGATNRDPAWFCENCLWTIDRVGVLENVNI